MSKSRITYAGGVVFLFIFMALTSRAADPVPANSWCTLKTADITVASNTFFARVLPDEALPIKITPYVRVTNLRWSVDSGHLSGSGLKRLKRLYTPPRKPGRYPVEVIAYHNDKKYEATIQVFVLEPFESMENYRLNGFYIGPYPDPAAMNNSPHYQYPEGFMKVTRKDKNVHITENYRLGDFLPHGYSGWPKYTIVNEKLALKLEIVTRELKARGLMKTRLKFLSAFRPPARNTGAGQAEFSRHQYGCALDMYVDDTGSPNWMDDLDGDGKEELRDALLLYKLIDHMKNSGLFDDGLQGGLGAYPQNSVHGPFIHMDVRGSPARWMRDRYGNAIGNISAFLQLPRNEVIIPPRKQVYASRGIPRLSSGREDGHTYSSIASPTTEFSSLEGLKNQIRSLEREVLSLEQRWSRIAAVSKPLTSDDLYIAADVANESMMLNRGKIILKRITIKKGKPAPSCPEGLDAIYSVPSGILEIRDKKVSPAWFPPEWAFLGSSLSEPFGELRKNFLKGEATENTLDLGAGIRIHPPDLAGKTALPGSIRVSAKDMNTLHRHTSKGARVYLFKGGAYFPGNNAPNPKKKNLMTLKSFLMLRKRSAALGAEHLVLDLENERGWIKRGDKVVRALDVKLVGPCFSKSYPEAAEKFKMPRGTLLVKKRMTNPPWYKPDWMYREQDKEAPGPLGADRVQNGLIGQYALYLGGGLVIHGRHSPLVPDKAIDYVAIELPPEDLKWVWRTIPTGAATVLR